MSNDTLPVTFRSSPRTGLVAVGIGVLVIAVGVLKLTDDTGNESFGPIQVSGSTAGWLFAVAGAVIVLVGLVALVRRCPSLTLGEAGIVYTPCVGALVEVGWSQLTDVTVRHATVAGTRGRRGASFEFGLPRDKRGKAHRPRQCRRGAPGSGHDPASRSP